MYSLEEMLNIDLLNDSKRRFKTANLFGFIAYSERNPYVAKVLQDKFFWDSLNVRSRGWIVFAIRPNSSFYGGANADFINQSLGVMPEEYPQFVILAIDTDKQLLQCNYPISDGSIDDAYKSIQQIVDEITHSITRINPENKSSTCVYREVRKDLDATLTSARWKRVSKELVHVLSSFLSNILG